MKEVGACIRLSRATDTFQCDGSRQAKGEGGDDAHAAHDFHSIAEGERKKALANKEARVRSGKAEASEGSG